MDYTVSYTLYLIGCAAKGEAPAQPTAPLDFERMFSISKEHQVENLVYVSLQKLSLNISDELLNKFRQCYEKAIVREARQEFELQSVCEAFTNAGIRHIPLKGSIVKYMYPTPDLRQCGDIDILVDTTDEDIIKSIMCDLGYECIYNSEKHIVCSKNRIHIEVHKHLVDSQSNSFQFLSSVWDTAIQTNNYTYEMSSEMLYMFLLIHLSGHLKNGGAGIKLIVDFYTFNKTIDMSTLHEYLIITKLDKLNNKLNQLIDFWFNKKTTSDEMTVYLSKFILNNGVYGSSEALTQMIYSNKTKAEIFKHYFRITFRPYSTMIILYPSLKKAPFLLPLCYCHRIVKKLTTDRKRTKGIWKESHNQSEDLSKFKELL